MKKILFCTLLAGTTILLTYCTASKKATKSGTKVNYESSVMAIMEKDCAPCHFPAQGGKKEPLDSYAGVTKHIDDILRRVQLNPTDRGFMPNRRAKLSDSTINVLKQWKADGLIEK